MKVIESVRCMQDICLRLTRERHKSIRLVPTMGALHDGHASLIERAREDHAHDHHADDDVGRSNCVTNGTGTHGVVVIVSIFVNPIQFNDPDDLAKYPKTIESDLVVCRKLNVDFVFMPKSEQIYGTKASEMCTVKPAARLACELEGRSRPAHFEGMLTIVNKLFNITRPQRAYFGEKDYQQLVLVSRMCEDLNMRVQICPVETVREQATGLPLSSRNAQLSLKQRHLAAKVMSETLSCTARLLEDKCRLGSHCVQLEATLVASLTASQLMLDIEETLSMIDSDDTEDTSTIITDYFELRCAKDLTVIEYDETRKLYDCQRGCCTGDDGSCESDEKLLLEARLLMSILVSKVRLLDNVCVRMNLPRRGQVSGAGDD